MPLATLTVPVLLKGMPTLKVPVAVLRVKVPLLLKLLAAPPLLPKS